MKSAGLTNLGSPITRWLSEQGRTLSPSARQSCVGAFDSVAETVHGAWDIDVLLTPTLAFTPPKIGYFSSMPPEEDFRAQTQWTPWATLFNMTGGAAISIPVNGVGIHLGGVRVGNEDILGLAAFVERAVA